MPPHTGHTCPRNVAEAPLLYVGPTQINFQVPPGIAPGTPVAVLEKRDGTTLMGWPQIVASAPGIFSLSGKGSGPGAVLNEDNSVNSPDNPAPRGSVIQIFATGGDTTPLLPPGQVLFNGLAPGLAGVWQVNARIPEGVTPGPAVLVFLQMGPYLTNSVTIAVQ